VWKLILCLSRAEGPTVAESEKGATRWGGCLATNEAKPELGGKTPVWKDLDKKERTT